MNPLEEATTIHLHKASQHVPTIIVFDRLTPDADDYADLDAGLLAAAIHTGLPSATYFALQDLLNPDEEE